MISSAFYSRPLFNENTLKLPPAKRLKWIKLLDPMISVFPGTLLCDCLSVPPVLAAVGRLLDGAELGHQA